MADTKPTLFLLEPTFHGSAYVSRAIDLHAQPVVIRRAEGPTISQNGCQLIQVVDIEDVEEVAREVQNYLSHHNAQTVGVLPGNEWMVPIAAAVAAGLDAVGNDVSAALCARDKVNMRLRFLSQNISSPNVLRIFTNLADVVLGSGLLYYPVVVKPSDMACSLFVRLVNSQKELVNAAEQIFHEAMQPLEYAARKVILVEEYIEGPEYSVELFLHSGIVEFSVVTAKDKGPLPYFVEIGHTVPAPVASSVERQLVEVATNAAASLGLKYGPCHVEIVIHDGTPKIIELAARVGGDNITKLVLLASDGAIDLHKMAIQQALGYDLDLFRPNATLSHGASIRYITSDERFRIGRISAMPFSHNPEICEIQTPTVGIEVRPPKSSEDRYGYVIAKSSSPELARSIARDAVSHIKLEPQ